MTAYAHITGNVTQDIELKSLQSGKKVASFTVAVNDRDHTSFFRCAAWEKTGEILSQYVKKGKRLTVHGELSIRKWTDSNGIEKEVTEINVRGFDLPPKEQGQPPFEAAKEAVSGSSHGADDDIIPF